MPDARPHPVSEPAIRTPATRRYFRRHFGLALLYLVLLVGIDVFCVHVIDDRGDLDDPGALYSLAIIVFIVTCGLYFWLAAWLLMLVSRRIAVAGSYWEPATARTAVAKLGPLRARVIGIDTEPGVAPLIVFSGALFSGSYRRQIDQSGSLYRLRRTDGRYRGLYAVSAGGRLFSNQQALVAGADGAWRRRALTALGSTNR